MKFHLMPPLLLLLLLAACSDPSLLELKIVTPPGTDPLATVDQLRLHVTDPAVDRTFQVTDSRTIDLEVTVEVESAAGVITLEGTSKGTLTARGETPPLLLTPADGVLSLLVARVGQTSLLKPAFKQPALGPVAQLLPAMGALVAGGTDAAGKPVRQAAVYDFFSHALTPLPKMPEARAGAVAAYCGSRCVSLALGKDATGMATTILSYDGVQWSSFADGIDSVARRTGAATAPLGDGTYVVAGGIDASGAALDTLLQLDPGTATSVPGLRKLSSRSAATRAAPVAVGAGGFVLVAGAGKAEVFSRASLSSQAVTLPGTAPHAGMAACALSDGALLLVGGRDAAGKALSDAWRVEPKTLKVTHYASALAAGRADHAVEQVGTRVVVVGGGDGSTLASKVELLDATTLKAVSQGAQAVPRGRPLLVRTGPGGLLVAGGVDSAGLASEKLEIFQRAEAIK